MKTHRYILYILFLLLALYNAQGWLYKSGSIISQGALFSVLIISFFYFVKTLLQKKKKNLFYMMWTLLFLLNVVGMVFTGSFSNPSHFSMFKNIALVSLSFYPFYFFSTNKIVKGKDFLFFLFIMLPITIGAYSTLKGNLLLEQGRENVVNNIAYSFVGLTPFLFLFKNRKWVSYLILLLICYFVIMGSKRGAMLTFGTASFVFLYTQLRTLDSKNRIKGYLLTFVGIVLVFYFAYDTYMSNEYLISRMVSIEDGNLSGRDILYSNIFKAWYNSDSIWHTLFGYGFASSLKLSGMNLFAHNDWLELLSNFGLFGVAIYVVLLCSCLRYVFYTEWSIDKRLMSTSIFLIWSMCTVFSMYYTSINSYLGAILLAYLIGSKSSVLE